MAIKQGRSPSKPSSTLVHSISCPHCGLPFRPERLKFLARSPALNFDHRLPEGQMRRFTPSYFSFDGDAIDAQGEICSETACPGCHLKIPRLLALRPTVPFSIFGSPSSGKSYLIGAMVRRLRESLSSCRLHFDDVDTEANEILLDYERRLFQQPTPDHWVYLEKTGDLGKWYSDVWYGPRRDLRTGAELIRNRKTFPKPFLLRIDTADGHPRGGDRDVGRVICLYDNAGEHFQVGGDRYNNVTMHLKESQGLIFVFDPTQDPKFRDACRDRSSDRQFQDAKLDSQEVLYGNVMNRLLLLRSKLPTVRVRIPLVVALTKFDAWHFLLGNGKQLPCPFRDGNATGPDLMPLRMFDPNVVQRMSARCREMLMQTAPHVVSAIEGRCDPEGIQYVPVSATGGPSVGKTNQEAWPFAPSPPPPDGYDYFLQKDIRPQWAEVPMLTLVRAVASGLLPVPS